MSDIRRRILSGEATLGVELGSTRIKAVLVDEDCAPVASGDFTWENRLEDGVWTYRMEDAWTGLQTAYANLKADVWKKYGVKLTRLKGLGVSGMMHGYLPFDADGRQLVGFRTWRNTMTARAAEELTELLGFHIPQRWSIAHLYQAILNGEPHVGKIAYLTTLAGYVHWQLTGRKALGVGEASGMFPVDGETLDYDRRMIDLTDAKIAEKGCSLRLRDILPEPLVAGEDAGCVTEAGAKLLDPSGELEPGFPAAPPEGDAGSGMAATNSVAVRTGNVSAGTSVFAMVVLEKPLSKPYPEIDMVATPAGRPVAMVHCNNCTSDINAWAGMLRGFAEAVGTRVDMNDIYTALFTSAMQGEKDCGGVVDMAMLSGEPAVGLEEGRPMLARMPESKLSFANFARSLAFGALAGLKTGMEILAEERVRIDALLGHGGYFKTPGTGQKILAAALKTPVSVMETAGEGGPWGMALLASYRANRAPGQILEDYLNDRVFAGATGSRVDPDPEDVAGFDAYARRFAQALEAEKVAVRTMR